MSGSVSTSNLEPKADMWATNPKEFGLHRSKYVISAMPLRFVIISIVLLIPCWWQPQIAAGDLASHAYNAWLVQLVKQGQAPGLSIAPETTNVLFDFMLDGLIGRVDVVYAQRLVVGFCVLVFFWAAFALATTISGKTPWFLAPLLAVLAYGTVFNMGLFNYYLAGALALAGLAVLWRATLWNGLVGLVLLALAWLAQPLPALWAGAIFGYVVLARNLAPRIRMLLVSACIGVLFLVRLFILHFWRSTWGWRQALHITGADQSYMFGHHYRWVTVLTLAIWATALVHLVRERGWKRFANSIPVQVYILCVVGCFLLPYTILLPMYPAAFGGVSDRIAWLAAVIMCGLVAKVRNVHWYGWASTFVAVVYFSFLYSDARAINNLEAHVVQLVSTLPDQSRILAELHYPTVDGFDESMLADRACIGKCFSFGNYKPRPGNFAYAPCRETPLFHGPPTTLEQSRGRKKRSSSFQANLMALFTGFTGVARIWPTFA